VDDDAVGHAVLVSETAVANDQGDCFAVCTEGCQGRRIQPAIDAVVGIPVLDRREFGVMDDDFSTVAKGAHVRFYTDQSQGHFLGFVGGGRNISQNNGYGF